MIFLPDYILRIIKKIESAGHKAYCVGGAVRDLLLGLTPTDYDICSSMTPEEIISLFPHTVPTGIKHGTVTVIEDEKKVEITTFRSDGDYSDNRHPEQVKFVRSLETDLVRRDFTINSLAFDGKNLVDITGGLSDLEGKIIRAVGDAETRFSEDALRILRCFRFSAQLGFSIEKSTLSAAIKTRHLIENISRERIAAEIIKIFESGAPELASQIFEEGTFLFLSIPPCKISPILDKIEKNASLRLAVFMFTNGLDTEKISDELKFSNKMREEIAEYIKVFLSHDYSRAGLKRLLRFCKAENVEAALKAKKIFEGADYAEEAGVLADIIAKGEPYKTNMLNIGGKDVLALGFSGERVGEILNFLLDKCIENPSLNQKEILLSLIHQ